MKSFVIPTDNPDDAMVAGGAGPYTCRRSIQRRSACGGVVLTSWPPAGCSFAEIARNEGIAKRYVESLAPSVECARPIGLAEGDRQQRDVEGVDLVRHAAEEHAGLRHSPLSPKLVCNSFDSVVAYLEALFRGHLSR
jgi:hypothetical protein